MRFLLALVLAIFAAHADAQTFSSSKTRVWYTVTGVAADAAISTGALDTLGVNEATVILINGNTTQTRTPTFTFYKDDGTTVMYTIAASACAASTTCVYAFGKGVTSTGITAAYALTFPPKFKVSTNAPPSGTGTSSLHIWSR